MLLASMPVESHVAQAPQRTRIVDGEIIREDDVPSAQRLGSPRHSERATMHIPETPHMSQPSRHAGQIVQLLMPTILLEFYSVFRLLVFYHASFETSYLDVAVCLATSLSPILPLSWSHCKDPCVVSIP